MIQVSKSDYAAELLKNKSTMFVDIVDKDTGEPRIYKVSGLVVYGPYKGEYGSSIGIATEGFEGSVTEIEELLKERALKKYKKLDVFRNYKDDKNVIFFKLKTDKEGKFVVISNIEIQDEDMEIPKNLDLRGSPVTITTSIGVYMNPAKKEYGLFYKPTELSFE